MGLRRESHSRRINKSKIAFFNLKLSYKGTRPAIGYPSLPDHSIKRVLWKLLKVEENIGIKLTENLAMNPVCR